MTFMTTAATPVAGTPPRPVDLQLDGRVRARPARRCSHRSPPRVSSTRAGVNTANAPGAVGVPAGELAGDVGDELDWCRRSC